MPEGTAWFPDEPILRVAVPMSQAQRVEVRSIDLFRLPEPSLGLGQAAYERAGRTSGLKGAIAGRRRPHCNVYGK